MDALTELLYYLVGNSESLLNYPLNISTNSGNVRRLEETHQCFFFFFLLFLFQATVSSSVAINIPKTPGPSFVLFNFHHFNIVRDQSLKVMHSLYNDSRKNMFDWTRNLRSKSLKNKAMKCYYLLQAKSTDLLCRHQTISKDHTITLENLKKNFISTKQHSSYLKTRRSFDFRR